MFTKTALYYDKIYAFKDYQAETERLMAIFQEQRFAGGTRLLDVACGTGRHLEFLKARYDVEGMDISPELLAIARRPTDALYAAHERESSIVIGK